MNIVELSKCNVLDEHGNEVRLSSFWKNQTVMFIFLRHFGCIACRGHAQQIWNDREKYEKSGAKIIFIGNGSLNYLKYFKEDLKIQAAPVYTDPTLNSFVAAGFKRNFRAILNFQTLSNIKKLRAQGFHQKPLYDKDTGDYWQLGGILVVNPHSKVTYHYISQVLGDFPPEKDLLAVNNHPPIP